MWVALAVQQRDCLWKEAVPETDVWFDGVGAHTKPWDTSESTVSTLHAVGVERPLGAFTTITRYLLLLARFVCIYHCLWPGCVHWVCFLQLFIGYIVVILRWKVIISTISYQWKNKEEKKSIWVREWIGIWGQQGLSVLQRELEVNKYFCNENI